MSWMPTVITYDLGSSSTKSSSSLLLSLASKISTPFVEGIVVVVDTDFAGIAAKDIVVVDIVVVDIEQADTEAVLVHLAFSHHFSSSRYPPSFLAVDKVL